MSELFDTPMILENKFPEPRPFQVSAHEELRKGFSAGNKNQILCSATGSGKTFSGLKFAFEALKKGKRVLFVCDRTTLINQTSETADRYGLISHGIIQANHWRRNENLPFQIGSVQTLAKRGYWPKADLIIVDEAHTLYKAVTDYIGSTKAAVIGLTATPFTKGLGKHYSHIVNATTMHGLVQSGVLVPMRIFSCKKINMKGAKTLGGEWTDIEAEKRGLEIVGDVVSEWLKHGENRKTIVFGATIKHCQEICKQFLDVGVMAAVFTAETKDVERKYLLDEFRKPNSSLRVLISVEALAKGFDVPDVGCVSDCRPLRKSLSTAIQMWGRGLRSSPETGKQDCILLDHSGNILRFNEDFTDIYFNGVNSLDDGEKLDQKIRPEKEDREIKGCPSCGYKPFFKRCMACGYEINDPSLLEHVPGEMQEITQAVMAGKKKLADDHYHLWQQVCTYAREHSAPEKQKGRAYHLYKDIAGREPGWYFHTTPNTEITNNVMNKIKSMTIAYVRGKAKGATHAVH